MALSYPLPFSRVMDIASIASSRLTLSDPRQFNQTGGGEVLSSSLGSRLWTGEITLTPAPHKTLAGLEARLELLMEPGASFFVYDKRCAYPAGDPDGSIFGVSTPTLSAVAGNNKDITIAGLPANYPMQRGDMLSFTYLSSPTRYALHRVAFAATPTADGSGTIVLQVIPNIRAGYTLGTAVTFIKPYTKAVVLPGTYQAPSGSPGRLSAGLSFQFTQTLR